MTHQTYSSIGLETEVLEASPHRLVQFMFEKSVQLIHESKRYMLESDVPNKCKSISRTLDIIAYLKMSLNFDNPDAKELSTKLSEVYGYIEHELMEANLKNNPQALDRALQKLLTIKSAWDAIPNEK